MWTGGALGFGNWMASLGGAGDLDATDRGSDPSVDSGGSFGLFGDGYQRAESGGLFDPPGQLSEQEPEAAFDLGLDESRLFDLDLDQGGDWWLDEPSDLGNDPWWSAGDEETEFDLGLDESWTNSILSPGAPDEERLFDLGLEDFWLPDSWQSSEGAEPDDAFDRLEPLPESPGYTMTARPGDTLWDMAQQLGVELRLLTETNPHLADGNLRPGDKVIVPTALYIDTTSVVGADPQRLAQEDAFQRQQHIDQVTRAINKTLDANLSIGTRSARLLQQVHDAGAGNGQALLEALGPEGQDRLMRAFRAADRDLVQERIHALDGGTIDFTEPAVEQLFYGLFEGLTEGAVDSVEFAKALFRGRTYKELGAFGWKVFQATNPAVRTLNPEAHYAAQADLLLMADGAWSAFRDQWKEARETGTETRFIAEIAGKGTFELLLTRGAGAAAAGTKRTIEIGLGAGLPPRLATRLGQTAALLDDAQVERLGEILENATPEDIARMKNGDLTEALAVNPDILEAWSEVLIAQGLRHSTNASTWAAMVEGLQRSGTGSRLGTPETRHQVDAYRNGRMVADLATMATKNPNARTIVLGKFNEGGVSYAQVARDLELTYFELDPWTRVAGSLGDDAMWEINKAFLKQQLAQGKGIVLTHDPWKATGYFKREVRHLLRAGYTFTRVGSEWRAVR